jgi:hypothetical protein
MMAKAITSLYNAEPSFAKSLADGGFSAVAAKGAGAGSITITLADLSKHDAIEHDASLVRYDARQGDNTNVQPALLRALLDDAAAAGGDGGVTVKSLGRTRARRERESRLAGSPALSAKASSLAYGEAALLLMTLGGNGGPMSAWNAPRQQVEEWLGQERLPSGYVRPKNALTAVGVSLLAASILAAAK